MIDCDPCNCIEGYYRDEQSWRKAIITLLCDIETSLETYINLENLWDKSLGVIYPHISTDNVLIPASLSVTTDIHIGNNLIVDNTAEITSVLTLGSNVIYENLTTSLYASTNDASDKAMLQLSGGGAVASPTRGATIYIAGNERASYTGSIKLESGNVSSSKIEFLPGGYVGWNFNRTASNSSHELVFGRSDIASSSATIKGARNDGSDDGILQLTAGGAVDAARGAYEILYGNENGSHGNFVLGTGDKADASGYIRLNNSSGLFYIQAGTNTLWSFEYDGDLQQDATYGGDLVFNRAGKGVCDKLATLAATGSVLADAAQIAARITIASGADNTKGLKLPSAALSGAIYRVINPDVTYSVNLYPGSSSHKFKNRPNGMPAIISTERSISVVFDGTDTWYLVSLG